jgi:hypothetical protein
MMDRVPAHRLTARRQAQCFQAQCFQAQCFQAQRSRVGRFQAQWCQARPTSARRATALRATALRATARRRPEARLWPAGDDGAGQHRRWRCPRAGRRVPEPGHARRTAVRAPAIPDQSRARPMTASCLIPAPASCLPDRRSARRAGRRAVTASPAGRQAVRWPGASGSVRCWMGYRRWPDVRRLPAWHAAPGFPYQGLSALPRHRRVYRNHRGRIQATQPRAAPPAQLAARRDEPDRLRRRNHCRDRVRAGPSDREGARPELAAGVPPGQYPCSPGGRARSSRPRACSSRPRARPSQP